ncbi:LysR family transcriptional regulator [Tateyamaria sp.]|uniref:LysR family transcriptional regulator n=1 Tax=Tateyamaria sp. TaxID=1929288 RepID=UPI003B2143F9
MPKSLPPLTWFRAFDAAARHLSFTAAADELGFTQSAISQHVRALEQRLGAPLFIRGKRALILTEAGRGLVPDVAAAMAQLAQATERFVPTQEVPKLTIATSASVSQWVLAPGLRHFHAAHPGVALQLVSTIWPDDFSATRADIDIRFGAQAVVGRNAQLLEPSELCAVVAEGQPIDWDRAVHLPMIQPVGLSTGWQDIGRAMGRRNWPAPLIEVDTHGLAVDLALQGAGVALTHSLIAQRALQDGRLVALDIPQTRAIEGYYLAQNATNLPIAQQAFVDWFRHWVQP